MQKKLHDGFKLNDSVGNDIKHKQNGLWAKTQVLVGYGRYIDDMGISQLNETVFDGSNLVPIGGVQYAMEQIFGVTGSLHMSYLNDLLGIGAQSSELQPTGSLPYPYGHSVCLFGVGTGGAADNNITTLEVKYNEQDITSMVPFRYTGDPLSVDDKLKYYGKKDVDGLTAYYLKRFDTDPVIRHLRKDGVDGEDGTEVTNSIFQSELNDGVESFTEILLTISKKDVREWFTANGQIEVARVNSIALFNAVYDESLKDYAMIKMFSKLNIPTEPLSLTKDMEIIYRVYGS